MKDEEWLQVRNFCENLGLNPEAAYNALKRGLVGDNPLSPWDERLNKILAARRPKEEEKR